LPAEVVADRVRASAKMEYRSICAPFTIGQNNLWFKCDIELPATASRHAAPPRLCVAFSPQPISRSSRSRRSSTPAPGRRRGDGSRPLRCRWDVLSHDMRPVRASCGLEVAPRELADRPSTTTSSWSGGSCGRTPALAELFAYLGRAAAASRTLVGVCTGSFLLARAGLMRQHRSCVSWFHYRDFMLEFPDHARHLRPALRHGSQAHHLRGGTSVVHLAAHLIGQP
jgi:hypothetical protein